MVRKIAARKYQLCYEINKECLNNFADRSEPVEQLYAQIADERRRIELQSRIRTLCIIDRSTVVSR
jgi:hypothetical protein